MTGSADTVVSIASNATYDSVTFKNGDVSGGDRNGLVLDGASGVAHLVIANATFSGNGTVNSSASDEGAIAIIGYNGDVTLSDVTVQNPGAGAENGIQIIGSDPRAPMGTVTFDNVNVTGTYLNNGVAIYDYSSATGHLVIVNEGLNVNVDAGQFGLNIDNVGGTISLAPPAPVSVVNTHAGASNDIAIQGLDDAAGDTFTADASDDLLVGRDGNDTMYGRDGNDVLIGGGGDDTLFGGKNDDTFIYTVGDGHDTIDGGQDTDTLIVNGDAGAQSVTLTATSATGFTVDTDGAAGAEITASNVEKTIFNMGAGADALTVSTMDTADTIILAGTASNFTITGTNLPATTVKNSEAITVQSNGGNDVIDASQLVILPGSASQSQTATTAGTGTAGNGAIGGFGDTNTQYTAQTFVASSSDVLSQLSFSLRNPSGVVDFRVLLVAWDAVNNRPAGNVLYESNTLVADTAGDTTFTVAPGLSLTQGQTYAFILDAHVEGTTQSGLVSVVNFGPGSPETAETGGVFYIRPALGSLSREDAFAETWHDGLADRDLAYSLTYGGPQALGVTLDGGAGDDTIIGSTGDDTIFGGADNDTITGGKGNDTIDGGTGDDTFNYALGDGHDTIEGGSGTDTLKVDGDGNAQSFTLTATSATGFTLDTDGVAGAEITASNVEKVTLNMGAGTDAVTVSGLNTGETITLTGTAANLTVSGTNMPTTTVTGAESVTIKGEGGDDTIDASGLGTPAVTRGTGLPGNNGLVPFGDNVAAFAAQTFVAGGERLSQLSFSLSSLTGAVDFRVLLVGWDTVNNKPMGGVPLYESGTLLYDTAAQKTFTVEPNATLTPGQTYAFVLDFKTDGTALVGTAAIPVYFGAEAAEPGGFYYSPYVGSRADVFAVNFSGLFANDADFAYQLVYAAQTVDGVTLDGGAGNDTIIGSIGNDIIHGGADNDTITGGRGDDTIDGGTGDDTFNYALGDGHDTIDGGQDTDTLIVTGDAGAQSFTLKATAATGFTLDTDGVAGAEITATNVEKVTLNMAGGSDTLTVEGSSTDETITLAGTAANFTVSGTHLPTTAVKDAEFVTIQGGDGNDTIDASALAIASGSAQAGSTPTTVGTGVNGTGLANGFGDASASSARYVGQTFVAASSDLLSQLSFSLVYTSGTVDFRVLLVAWDAINNRPVGGSPLFESATLSASNPGFETFTVNPNLSLTEGQTYAFILDAHVAGTVQTGTTSLAMYGANQPEANTPGAIVLPYPQDYSREDAFSQVWGGGTATGDYAYQLVYGAPQALGVTLDGGAGNDTITGSSGSDIVNGGTGNDTVDGGAGNDVITGGEGDDTLNGGEGNDTFIYAIGDGTDTIDGGAGTADTLKVTGNGSAQAAIMAATATGFTLDLDGVNGADITAANVEVVNIDLGLGFDTLTFIGRDTGERITVSGVATNFIIAGTDLPMTTVTGAESVLVQGAGGNDTIDASGLDVASTPSFGVTLDGGAGNDTLIGTASNDTIYGGADNDTITGGRGDDTIDGGTGDDTFNYALGDGVDTVDGGEGTDTIVVTGDNAAQAFTLTATSSTAFVLDLDGAAGAEITASNVEKTTLNMGAGTDTLTVNGLATGETITLSGTNANFTVSGTNLPTTTVKDAEGLTVHGEGGDDVIDASALVISPDHEAVSAGPGLAGANGKMYGIGDDHEEIGNRYIAQTFTAQESVLSQFSFALVDVYGHLDFRAMIVAWDSVNNHVVGTTPLFQSTTLDVEYASYATFTVATPGLVLTPGTTYAIILDAQFDGRTQQGGAGISAFANIGYPGSAYWAQETVWHPDPGYEGQSGWGVPGYSTYDHTRGVWDLPWSAAGNSTYQFDFAYQLVYDKTLTQTFVTTLDGGAGDDVITGSTGNDLIYGGADNDTINYTVGNGHDVVDGGTGNDRLNVSGNNADETYAINLITLNGVSHVGINAEGSYYYYIPTTASNYEVAVRGVEDIYVSTNDGRDTVFIAGSFDGVDVSAFHVDLGTGNDVLDLTFRTAADRVIADGGADTDIVYLDFAMSDVYGATSNIYDDNGVLIGVKLTHTVGGVSITDEFTNFEYFSFKNGPQLTLEEASNKPPVIAGVIGGAVTEDATSAFGPSLVANGGFEEGAVDGSIPQWAFEGDWYFVDASNPNDAALFIPGSGKLSQSFMTTAGTVYTVEFSASEFIYDTTVRVMLNGAALGPFINLTGAETQYSYTFVGTGDFVDLAFQSEGAGFLVLDDISVRASGTATETTSGLITFTDVDSGVHTMSYAPGTSSYTSFLGTFEAHLVQDSNGGTGQIAWTFSVADSDIQFMQQGQVITQTYLVEVADATGGISTETVTVKINGTNDLPATQGTSANGIEDAVSIAIQLAGSDVDGPVTGFVINTQVAHGTLYGDAALTQVLHIGSTVTAIANAATVYFVPDADWSGSTSFDFSAADGFNGFDATPATATITVAEGDNDAPVLTASPFDNYLTATEDVGEWYGVVGETLYLAAGFTVSDPDDAQLTVSTTFISVVGNGGATVSSDLLAAFQSVDTYYLDFMQAGGFNAFISNALVQYLGEGQSVTANYLFTVADPHGASAQENVSFTIFGTNDAPQTALTAATGNEDGVVAVTLSGSDIDGTVSSFTIGSLPQHGTLYGDANLTQVLSSGAFVAASGNAATVYFKPDANWNGSTSFQYAAKDNSNAADATAATASIVVNAVGDAPQGADAAFTMSANHTRVLTLADFGFSDVDGDAFTGVTIASLPQHGVLTDNLGVVIAAGAFVSAQDIASGHLVFTPATGEFGDGYASFAFQVHDSGSTANGGQNVDQTPNSITFNVLPPNATPEFLQPSTTTGAVTEDESYVLNANLLTNGGFEQHVGPDFPGWTIVAPAGASYNNSGSHHSGVLGAIFETSGANGQHITLSQDVATQAGVTYTITFWALNAYGTNNSLDVVWNGDVVKALANVPGTGSYGGPYTLYSVNVTGVDGTSHLTFDMSNSNWWVLDDVSVSVAKNPGTESQKGILSFDDADLTDTHTVVATADGQNYLGTFNAVLKTAATGAGTGAIEWTFSVNDSAIQHLGVNDVIYQTYTVKVSDGNPENGDATQTVTVAIHGTNDAPTLSSLSQSPSATEDSDPHTLYTNAVFEIGDVDGDVDFTSSYTLVNATTSGGAVVSAALLQALQSNAYTDVITTQDERPAVYLFAAIDNPLLQYLGTGQSVTANYRLTVSDGHGGTVEQIVSFTYVGVDEPTNAAPTVTSTPWVVSVAEDASYSATIPEMIQNGGFETGAANGVGAGWNVVVPQGAGVGRAGVGHSGGANALFQTYYADLPVQLSQDVATVAGQHYTLSYWLFTSYGTNNALSVTWNGQVIQAIANNPSPGNNSPSNYTQYTFDVVGDADGVSQLQFNFTNKSSYWFLDDVSLKAVNTAGVEARSGIITFSDGNIADAHAVSVTPVSNGYKGTFTASITNGATGDGAGIVTWHYTANDADLQYLAAGQTAKQYYDVTITDNSSLGQQSVTQRVEVDLVGVNDAPTDIVFRNATNTVVAAANNTTTLSIAENSANGTTVGKATAVDVDTIDTHSYAFWNGTTASQTSADGRFAINASTGAITVANGALLDYENSGASHSFGYTVKITDNNGASYTESLTVALTDVTEVVATADTLTVVNNIAPPTSSGWQMPNSGWMLNSANGHYYKVVIANIGWDAAKTAAENAGGYLATIANSAENYFIIDNVAVGTFTYNVLGQLVVTNGVWIGASDAASEGSWRWMTGPEAGTLTSYAPWMTGQNSGASAAAEDYAYLLPYSATYTTSWGDATNAPATSDGQWGYVIEYGGQTKPVEDGTFTISAASLLANDIGTGLQVVSVQSAQHGTVSLSNGTITFVPGANYTGAAGFTYTVQDNTGATSTSTVSFNIAAVDDGAAPVNVSGTAQAGSILTANLGVDPDGAISNITYQWMRDGVNIGSATGSTYTVQAGDIGHKVSVWVNYTDGQNFSDGTYSAAVTIANRAPTAANDSVKLGGYTTFVPGNTTTTPVVSEIANNDLAASPQDIARTMFGVANNQNLGNQSLPSFTVNGSIATLADKDFYRIYLKAGETITLDIDTAGNGLDSYLTLRNATGGIVAFNDDSAFNVGGAGSSRKDVFTTDSYDSYLSYTVATSGYYTIGVESWNNNPTQDTTGDTTGSYQLQVSIANFVPDVTGTNRIAVADLLANDTDADVQTLSIVSVAGTGVSLVDSNRYVEVQWGVSSFTYTVTDGTNTSTATVNVEQFQNGYTIQGTSQADILVGNSGADVIYGGDGNDTLIGGGDIDDLRGQNGNDVIRGGAMNDLIYGGAGIDYLDFSDGTAAINVTLVQSASPNTMDVSSAGLGVDTYRDMEGVIGTRFNDTLTGSGSTDYFRGGAGSDTIDGLGGTDYLDFADGTAGINVTLVQSSSYNTMDVSAAGLGIDTYRNMEGVIGTKFNDVITGSSGNDFFMGGAGDDRLIGNGGYDVLNGEDGNDIIRGGAGDDFIDGGAGIDLLDFSDGTAGINFTLYQSSNFVSIDVSSAGLGVDSFMNMEGVIGTNFNDTLTGTTSADVLMGGGGNDRLIGGAGNDKLTGGTGADTFVFAHTGAANADIITDYSGAEGDKLDLSALLDAAFGPTSNVSDFARIVGSGADLKVQVDTDGAGTGQSWTDVATLSGYNQAGNQVLVEFENQVHQLTVAA